MGGGPNERGASRKHIEDAVADSLRKLQTSYIDLYQVHVWAPDTPLSEQSSVWTRSCVAAWSVTSAAATSRRGS